MDNFDGFTGSIALTVLREGLTEDAAVPFIVSPCFGCLSSFQVLTAILSVIEGYRENSGRYFQGKKCTNQTAQSEQHS